MKIEVKNFRVYEKNTLQGFFDLSVPPFLIKSLTLHRKNGSVWIGFPAMNKIGEDGQVVRNADGKVEYSNCVAIPDKETFGRFKEWCLKEVETLEAEAKRTSSAEPRQERVEEELPF